MRTFPTRRNRAALLAALAVFAAVLVVAGRRTDSAPLPEEYRASKNVAMFGGSPARNLVNLLDRNIPTDWCVKPGQTRNVKWTADLGTKANGCPVLAGGRIFVGTNNGRPRDPNVKGDKGVLMCFDEKTGQFLWQAVHDKLPTGRINDWPEKGICSTPAVEGDRLYYVSNRCEVICASPKTGAVIWCLDMIRDFEVFPHNMSSCSPLLVGDLLFVVTGNGVDAGHVQLPSPHAPSFLALDKHTGKMVWSYSPSTRIRHGQWSNPVYAEAGGRKMVVFPGGDGWLYAFDPPTGRLLWKFDCNPKVAAFVVGPRSTWNHFLATPVVWEKKLYVGVGDDPEHLKGVGHLWCVDLERAVANGAKNPGNDVSPVDNDFDPKAPANRTSALGWHFGGARKPTREDFRPYFFGRTMSTCCVHDGLLYAAEFDARLHCLDARTGEVYWQHDMDGDTWNSPYWVDGKVYLGNEVGDVLIFEHGRKKKLIRTVEMRGMIRSTPVARAGVLYVVTENPCKLCAIAAR